MAKTPIPTLPGGMDAGRFLTEYWQKKPLFIPNAFPDWEDPLSPDELAGLATETGIESRLVQTGNKKTDWQVDLGPFAEGHFNHLPKTGWSLLVQEVNHFSPAVAALLAGFRFLPGWRLDDIMASFSAPGGTVGPHVDSYDVFLIQGSGQRLWQVGKKDDPTDLIPDLPLQVLSEFTPEHEWRLVSGDMLYLPPGVPHHGVGDEPCTTWSIGFRAPTHAEMAASYLGERLDATDPNARWQDPNLSIPDDPARIDTAAIKQARRILADLLGDDATVGHWFGCHVTTPRGGAAPEPPALWDDVAAALSATGLVRPPWSRWAYVEGADGRTVFADGVAYAAPEPLAELIPALCAGEVLTAHTLRPMAKKAAVRAFLCAVFGAGSLAAP